MKIYKNNVDTYKLIKEPTNIPKAKFTTSKDIAQYLKEYVYEEDIEVYESMYVLLLNRANNTIGVQKLSQGGTSGTVIDVKLLAKYAIGSLASAVILIHNHPSGNLQPSQQDIVITRKAQQALKILDIKLLDHIIIVPGFDYYSLVDNNDI